MWSDKQSFSKTKNICGDQPSCCFCLPKHLKRQQIMQSSNYCKIFLVQYFPDHSEGFFATDENVNNLISKLSIKN